MKYFSLFICLLGLSFASDDGLERGSTIPVVDLSEYYNEETRDAFIEEVREALHTVGFFGVKNTNIDQRVLDAMYAAMETFFALDRETKMEVDASKMAGQRGYVGGEAAKGSDVFDAKEFYMIGRSLDEELMEEYGLLENQWTTAIDFKTPSEAFYNELEKYSELFQEIFSLALGKEADFLKKICRYGDTSTRVIHYPKDYANDKAVWAGAHTDIDLFTILPRSTADGLEVMDDHGNWIPVRVKEDGIIINGGDFLEAYSNGYFKSSMHRVRRPEGIETDRYSAVHFVHPPSPALVYPLQEWIEKTGGERRYIDATRWELLMERIADLGLATDFILEELGNSDLFERLMTVNRESEDAMRAVLEAGYASDAVKERLNESS